jgi:hypothetical protein
MVLKGEILGTEARKRCPGCHKSWAECGVGYSAAGFYIGYWCCYCGPVSRESSYYPTCEDAEEALRSGHYGRS